MTRPTRAYGKHFRLGKKYSLKEELKLILQKAVTHEQELGDLKDIFSVVEGRQCESPTLAQWQRMNDRLSGQLSARRPTAASYFTQWRDWWLATDSYWKVFIACVLCALIALVALVVSYFMYKILFGHATSAVVASGSLAHISCIAGSIRVEITKLLGTGL
jgi:hypothetical protein